MIIFAVLVLLACIGAASGFVTMQDQQALHISNSDTH